MADSPKNEPADSLTRPVDPVTTKFVISQARIAGDRLSDISNDFETRIAALKEAKDITGLHRLGETISRLSADVYSRVGMYADLALEAHLAAGEVPDYLKNEIWSREWPDLTSGNRSGEQRAIHALLAFFTKARDVKALQRLEDEIERIGTWEDLRQQCLQARTQIEQSTAV